MTMKINAGIRSLRKFGIAGFLFFLAKGILWLLAPGILAWWM